MVTISFTLAGQQFELSSDDVRYQFLVSPSTSPVTTRTEHFNWPRPASRRAHRSSTGPITKAPTAVATAAAIASMIKKSTSLLT